MGFYNGGFKRLSEHKTFEWEVYSNTPYLSLNRHFNIDEHGIKSTTNIFNIFGHDIHLTRCEDHAGFKFELTLFGVTAMVEIYDNRHWNDDEDRWYNPGEEET